MDAEGSPIVLVLEVVLNLKGKRVQCGVVSLGRSIGGDEGLDRCRLRWYWVGARHCGKLVGDLDVGGTVQM